MNTLFNKFTSAEVAIVFDAYPSELRNKLFLLRQLIFDVADDLTATGGLTETLKWGQPSYLTKSKSGTTIRIDQIKSEPTQYALYFHCQTTLVETFRQLFPDTFIYSGNRAILFNTQDKLAEDELRQCIEMALTYHINKP